MNHRPMSEIDIENEGGRVVARHESAAVAEAEVLNFNRMVANGVLKHVSYALLFTKYRPKPYAVVAYEVLA